jgi:hypothetical protein
MKEGEEELLDMKAEVEFLRKELETLRKELMARDEREAELKRVHEEEIAKTKKSLWCVECESEAVIYCCDRVSYCSMNCETKHWNRGHEFKCTRPVQSQVASPLPLE